MSSNVQYIKPQPVSHSNSATPYTQQYTRATNDQHPMTRDFHQLDPNLRQELSKTINELTVSMNGNAKALIECHKILNNRPNSIDHAKLQEWHLGVRQNTRNFSRQNIQQLNQLKEVYQMNSSNLTQIDEISKNLATQSSPNAAEV